MCLQVRHSCESVVFSIDEKEESLFVKRSAKAKELKTIENTLDGLKMILQRRMLLLAMFRKHLGEQVYEYTMHEDRVRLLLDTDKDAIADEVITFADGFNEIEDGTGAGVLAIDGDVYYTCIPNLCSKGYR